MKAILISIVSGLIILGVWYWFMVRVSPAKAVLFIRWANIFVDENGNSYHGATPDDNLRDVIDAIPLKAKKDIGITLGVHNKNSRQIDNVILWVTFPEGIEVTDKGAWQHAGGRKYSFMFKNSINSGVYINVPTKIRIEAKEGRPGKHPFIYSISSSQFKLCDRMRFFTIYE